MMTLHSLRRMAGLSAAALLMACGGEPEPPQSAPADDADAATTETSATPPVDSVAEPVPDGPPEGSLDWALAGPWRSGAERGRDGSLEPAAVLAFFELSPDQTVLHAWPDSYYSDILSPYLHANAGRYIVASPTAWGENGEAADCEARAANVALAPCPHERVTLDAGSGALAEPGSVDLVLSVRSVHAWMALGVAEKAFADLFAALRPGGALGVIEARAPAGSPQDPGAASGYVQETYVRLLAEEAGFTFEAASDLGANVFDTTDHPFGVWTLAPHRRTSPLWAPDDPNFDRAPYDAIGEPDRMILLFRKPAE